MQKPLVTILCLCYNQERSIENTLRGFLMQQCDFEFDVLIHDDCSTDSTPQILEQICSQAEGKIRVVRPSHNRYSKEGLLPIYRDMASECRGQYIAYCEGDDYFTDKHKLQKQVDVFRTNSEIAIVHTGFTQYNVQRNRYSERINSYTENYSFEDLLLHNCICAPTAMCRADLMVDALDELVEVSIQQEWQTSDYPVWMYMAHRGKIGYIPESTAVYTKSTDSISNTKSHHKRIGFITSDLDIKNYFIEKYNPAEEVVCQARGAIACDLYKYTLRHRLPQKKIYRTMVLKDQESIPNKKIIFYAKHNWLEPLYF